MKKTIALGIVFLFFCMSFTSIGCSSVGVSKLGNCSWVENTIENEVNLNFNENSGEYVSLYYGELLISIEKHGILQLRRRIKGITYGHGLHFNADLDELKIELVLNYTAEMNYTIPYFAPIFAFGIKIENITKYKWEYFKLKKYYGCLSRSGNFSIVFNIDMGEIESGDELTIQPIISRQTVPSFFHDNYNESLLRLIRLIYHIPILNELLLSNWLFPKIATYEDYHWISAPLSLFFD